MCGQRRSRQQAVASAREVRCGWFGGALDNCCGSSWLWRCCIKAVPSYQGVLLGRYAGLSCMQGPKAACVCNTCGCAEKPGHTHSVHVCVCVIRWEHTCVYVWILTAARRRMRVWHGLMLGWGVIVASSQEVVLSAAGQLHPFCSPSAGAPMPCARTPLVRVCSTSCASRFLHVEEAVRHAAGAFCVEVTRNSGVSDSQHGRLFAHLVRDSRPSL